MRTIVFRNPVIGSIALIAAGLKATMEDEKSADPQNDTEFVKQFVAKAEKAEAAEKVEREKAAPGKGDEGRPAPVSKGKGQGDGADPDDDDPAAGGGEEEEVEEEIDEEEVDPDADEEEEEAVDEKEDDSDFGKRARDAKLPTSIDDLPDEAKPLVQKRLKEMESGFTRLMQKQATFREEQRAFRTEERYRETHKVEWLVTELLKDPKLEELVAAELRKLTDDESPYIREAAGVVAKDHRAQAAKAIADQEAEERKESERLEREDREQAAWVTERGSQVETLARKACTKNGIQFDRGVEAAIAYEISEQGDIEDSRIGDIVKEMATERGASIRAVRREEKKRHVQGKTETVRAASPLRPGQGRAGGPTTRSRKEPTLEENFAATAERLFPGEA